MRRRKIGLFFGFWVLLLHVALFSVVLNVPLVSASSKNIEPRLNMPYDDALVAPDLVLGLSHASSISSSPSPGYYETSEYFIGNVAVGVVFLESNGAIDPSTEDWTSTEESQMVSEIQVALNWWSSQNPSAGASFTLTLNYRVPTRYEPINRPHTDQGLWISEAMSYLGYTGTYYFTQVRDYINDLRTKKGTDWAFAMFIVDSSNDPDGSFTDMTPQGWYWFAYAYFGGPFLVMTYDNDNWGIDNMDRVTAHEMGHIFYATDEYNSKTEYSGYLNVADVDGSGALMDKNEWWLSSGTWGQVGWRDSDGDGLQDIVDTFPDTFLNPYSPDPTTNLTLTYTGTVAEIPYPNNNPYGTSRDVTINTITRVQFRIDSNAWIDANATDGIFDEAAEAFTFTTSSLSLGNHTIAARGINSVGNAETSFSSDTVTIIRAPVARFTYSPENPLVNEMITFNATLSAPNGGAIIAYDWAFGDGYTDSGVIVSHAYNLPGIFTVTLNITDSEGLWDTESKTITAKSYPVANFTYSPTVSYVGGTVAFNALASYDLDGSIVSYKWDFGDGNVTIVPNPTITHVYASQGTYIVNLTVTDNDGLTHNTTKSITVIEDSTPPTTFDNYDGLWHTIDFSITLTATDDLSSVAETYYKINDGPTKTVSTDGQPRITTEDANNKLEYWSVDNADNEESHHILIGIKLDKTVPTGTILINNGDVYTTSTLVTLTLTATDTTSGIYQVRYSNDGVWDTEPWETSSPTKTWTLTIGDGTKTVYYQIKDNAGLISITYSDTIILDATSPTGSITINDGATYTTTTTVTLTLSATDATSGIAEMCFSNDNITYTEWQTYATSKSWNLQGGDDAKTVYVQFRDQADLISTYSDTIILDTVQPTGSVTVAEGATYTNSASVTLTLSADDITSGVAQMRFSHDNITWTPWEPYSTSKAWTLTTGDGAKTVYVQFKDNAGLTSPIYQDTITLDTIKPIANAGVDQTVNEDTLVTFDASASQDENGIASYTWTFTDITPQTLTGKNPTYTFATPGTYTITLKVTDAAGNTATDTVIITALDITKPTANAGQAQTVNLGETVTFDASGSTDNVGIVSYEWNFGDGTTGTGKTTTYPYAKPGTYTVTLTVKDAADNSATHAITVTVRSAEAFPMWIVGAGVAIAAIGIAVVATLLLRKRK